jgi:hypothetical protein
MHYEIVKVHWLHTTKEVIGANTKHMRFADVAAAFFGLKSIMQYQKMLKFCGQKLESVFLKPVQYSLSNKML